MIVTVSVLSCNMFELIAYTVRQKIFFPSAVITIGFDPVTYSVLEDAGSVNVTVSILNGTLERNVVVTLLVPGGIATGNFNKHSSWTPTKTHYLFLYLSSWDRLY